MERDGVQPNTISYNCMINVCGAAESIPAALQLFEEMCEKGVKPSVITYNSLIKACIVIEI